MRPSEISNGRTDSREAVITGFREVQSECIESREVRGRRTAGNFVTGHSTDKYSQARNSVWESVIRVCAVSVLEGSSRKNDSGRRSAVRHGGRAQRPCSHLSRVRSSKTIVTNCCFKTSHKTMASQRDGFVMAWWAADLKQKKLPFGTKENRNAKKTRAKATRTRTHPMPPCQYVDKSNA